MPIKKVPTPQRIFTRVEKITEKTMTEILAVIDSYSTQYVPIDTGALLNSRFRKVESTPTGLIGTIGYVQEYAAPLHSPKPGGKMDNWQPVTPEDRAMKMSAKNYPSSGVSGGYNPFAQQGWLSLGIEESRNDIKRIIEANYANI